MEFKPDDLRYKYRAWDKVNSRMVEVIGMHTGHDTLESGWFVTVLWSPLEDWNVWGRNSKGENLYECHEYKLEPSECVRLQCLGRKDKKGVAIYEGDIARCEGGSYHAEVIYDDLAGFCLETHREDTRGHPEEMYLFSQSVVIGNRFENPELLEVE